VYEKPVRGVYKGTPFATPGRNARSGPVTDDGDDVSGGGTNTIGRRETPENGKRGRTYRAAPGGNERFGRHTKAYYYCPRVDRAAADAYFRNRYRRRSGTTIARTTITIYNAITSGTPPGAGGVIDGEKNDRGAEPFWA